MLVSRVQEGKHLGFVQGQKKSLVQVLESLHALVLLPWREWRHVKDRGCRHKGCREMSRLGRAGSLLRPLRRVIGMQSS